ncbi:FkbM family methyltransferase [Rhodospirillum sp. A1_3_36]|uniref:FkbM family methyltransferase n=1 Tax=Rhodospirillum sp. A1_3_36 TaxID=3391666 RepID=UPI0039A43A67
MTVEDLFFSRLGPDFEITIVDVGAAEVGEKPSYESLVSSGFARLIGFEPDETACATLNDKKEGKRVYYPYFVGDGRKATFYETVWPPTGSLYPPNTALVEKFQNLSEVMIPKAEHQVETVRLDDLQEIPRAEFIKLDVQGAELRVLENAVSLLRSTLVVQVEVEFVELYKGQPLFADVDCFLRSQGFQFHCFANGLAGRAFKPMVVGDDINRPLRQVLWADAIYVRDWMELDALSNDQLLAYALLSCLVLRSPDLSHQVLGHYDLVNGTREAETFMAFLQRR